MSSDANQRPAWEERPAFAGHWVCFRCRKMFKKSARECVCPQCANAMVEMGAYFEPPKQSSKRMWELLEALALTGFRFHTVDAREKVFGAARFGERAPSARTVMLRIRALLGEL